MAAKTKCPICDEAVWGFDLTRHLYGHLRYKMPEPVGNGQYIPAGYECWCGKTVETFDWWVMHLRQNGGWKVHYAACALGLNTKH
jgi:hypothetical protein